MLSKMRDWIANKVLKDVVSLALILFPLIFKAEEELGDGKGAEKNAQVVSQIIAKVREPGGIDLPEWALKMLEELVLPWLISLLVDFLNSQLGKNSESESGD